MKNKCRAISPLQGISPLIQFHFENIFPIPGFSVFKKFTGKSLPKLITGNLIQQNPNQAQNKMSFNVDSTHMYLSRTWFCWQRRKPLAYQVYPYLPSCRSIQEVHYLQVCLFLQEFQEDQFLGFLWDQWVPGVQGFQGVRLFRQHLCLPKIRFKKKTLLIRPFMLSTLH